MTLVIRHDRDVTLDDVRRVADGEGVELFPQTRDMLAERRRQIVDAVTTGRRPAYGFNRGFGHNVDLPVPDDRLGDLQENLLRSHCAGVGPPVDREIVRATIFLRAVSLSRGHSGVRPELVEALLALLMHDVTPVVPAYGSVGASGDLAPLSHIAAVLIGEGRAWIGDDAEPVKADVALARAGLTPLKLEMKEGLALNNGLQFSTAIGVLAWFRVRALLKTASLATALSTQVLLGADAPFRDDLHALRPHPGARRVARWIWDLMQDAPLREAHRPYEIDGGVQDPYSIRCAAQILGTCEDLLDEAARTFEIEANSVTDNPVLLPGTDGAFCDILSGGHFHGMPVAVKLYNLMQALAIMARLSNMRAARYVDQDRNKGLGSDLKWPDLSPGDAAVSSAMMIPEYASAALTNAIWSACTPSHLFSLSTDAGQEDHVSMSAGLAVRLWETIPRLSEVLAIELAFAAQAAAIRRVSAHIPSKLTLNAEQRHAVADAHDAYAERLRAVLSETSPFEVDLQIRLRYPLDEAQRHLSPACEEVLRAIYACFPVVTADRVLADDLAALAGRVDRGEILAVAESIIPMR